MRPQNECIGGVERIRRASRRGSVVGFAVKTFDHIDDLCREADIRPIFRSRREFTAIGRNLGRFEPFQATVYNLFPTCFRKFKGWVVTTGTTSRLAMCPVRTSKMRETGSPHSSQLQFTLPIGECPMFTKISLFVVALTLSASFAFAADDLGGLDLKNISDANDVVLEASLNVDVDALANKVQSEEAIEACFHRCGYYGGCGYSNYSSCYNYSYNPCCYSSCYTPCYSSCYTPCYSSCCSYTCYQPTYSVCYTPVTYTTYSSCCSPCYSYWGCH